MPFCLNCDGNIDRANPLFCSNRCGEIAKAVRYGRAVNADVRIDRDPTVRDALRIKIAVAVGGGYPTKQRKLSNSKREEVFERDKRMCRSCGADATEIDHIGGGVDGDVNHPGNLQTLCSACHRQKNLSNLRPATTIEILDLRQISERIESPDCLRDATFRIGKSV